MNRSTSPASASSAARAAFGIGPNGSISTFPLASLQVATARPSTIAKGRKMPLT